MERRTKVGFRKAAFFCVISVLLALTLWAAVSMTGTPVMAEESGECGENLTWTLKDGTLTIEGTGEMEDYDKDFFWVSHWEEKEAQIKKVVLSKGVTSIGDHAFQGCTNLSEITIPKGVTSIGEGAFEGCTELFSVSLPDGITSIRNNAFNGCKKLSKISIPDSVNSIESYAFGQCAFSNIILPDSTTSIEEGTFWMCTNLSEITIPKGVTSIGESAFEDCIGLTHINLPDSVVSIGQKAFYNTGLTGITLPDSVTSIEAEAFLHCEELFYIILPDSVTFLGSGAFYGCDELALAVIPDSVIETGQSIFGNHSLVIYCQWEQQPASWDPLWLDGSDSAVYWGEDVERISRSLTSNNITLAKLVKKGTCGNATWKFRADGSLTIRGTGELRKGDWSAYVNDISTLIIEPGITSIDSYTFNNFTGLRTVSIPDSVIDMENNVFDDCTQSGMRIFCQWDQQPRSWDPNWIANCNAVINWGMFPPHCITDELFDAIAVQDDLPYEDDSNNYPPADENSEKFDDGDTPDKNDIDKPNENDVDTSNDSLLQDPFFWSTVCLALLGIVLAVVLVVVLLRKKKSAPAAPARGTENPPPNPPQT